MKILDCGRYGAVIQHSDGSYQFSESSVEMLESHLPFVVSNGRGHQMQCECGKQGSMRETEAAARIDADLHLQDADPVLCEFCGWPAQHDPLRCERCRVNL